MNKYPQRKSHRLKEYNYTQSGYYYVTICAYDRNLLFGQISKPVGAQRAVPVTIQNKRPESIPEININQYGKIVQEEWENTQRLRNNVKLDEYIIMPNHVHGIIILKNTNALHNITDTARRVPTGLFGKPVPESLSTIIRSFKSAVSKRVNQLRQTITPPIWQRSFYDHVIRTDTSLKNIRNYIINNPKTWDDDEHNPKNKNHNQL